MHIRIRLHLQLVIYIKAVVTNILQCCNILIFYVCLCQAQEEAVFLLATQTETPSSALEILQCGKQF